MRLTELESKFVIALDERRLGYVDAMPEAQGVWFLCPVCFRHTGHAILVWFADRGVPPQLEPTPRWRASGTGLADLTLSPSINISRNKKGEPVKCGDAPGWHGFITNGEVT